MSKIKNALLEIFETVLTSAVVIFLIYSTIAIPEQVQGASMEPSFYNGERILVEKVTKHFKDFQTGEVVVLNPPNNDYVDFIKRVIAVPGDIVKIYNCEVYISRDGNRYKLDEWYLKQEECTQGKGMIKEGRSILLKDDEYLVLGDNRNNSADSRVFGLIPKERIVGRVIFKFWPLKVAGFVK